MTPRQLCYALNYSTMGEYWLSKYELIKFKQFKYIYIYIQVKLLISNITLDLYTQVCVYKQIARLEKVGLHDCLGKVELVISNRTLVL